MNERVLVVRESATRIMQIVADSGIKVTQQGSMAYVDHDAAGNPVRVNIPFIPDDASDELIAAIQGFMDHELGHILFSDLKLMHKSAGMGNIGILHNVIEDPCVAEAGMVSKFYGSAHNLTLVQEFFLNKYTTPKFAESLAQGDMEGVTGILMVPAIRAWAGQSVFKRYMADKWVYMEQIVAKLGDLVDEVAGCKTTADCFKLAVEMDHALRQKSEGQKQSDNKQQGESGQSEKSDQGEGEGNSGQDGLSDEKDDQDGGKQGSGTSKTDEQEKEEDGQQEQGKGSDDGLPVSEKPDSDGGDSEGAGDGEENAGNGANGGEEEDDRGSDQGDGEGSEGEASDSNSDGSEGDGKESGQSGMSGDGAQGDGEGSKSEEQGGQGQGKSGDGSTEGEGKGESDINGKKQSGEVQMDVGDSTTAIDWSKIAEEMGNGFDDALSVLISNAAIEANAGAEYVIFTKDHDKIEPMKVSSAYTDDLLTELDTKVRHMVGPIQKDLERAIAAQSHQHYESGKRSGRLNAAGLHRFAAGDMRVFRQKIVSESKDVAVSLVIDCSGSMRGRKINMAAQAAYALSQCLERMGIKHEVVGFTTHSDDIDWTQINAEVKKMGHGYTRIEGLFMPVLKGFNERLNGEVKKRFAWLPKARFLANNIDGESVEVAARRLLQRREVGKTMIVLSDGAPNCHGDNYAVGKHLKEVVKSCMDRGMKVVGIGIRSDAVQNYYPKSLVLNDVESLPGQVMKELKELLIH